MPDDQLKKFHQHIADNISNAYCDNRFFGILLAHGKQTLDLDERRVQSMLTLTLERLNCSGSHFKPTVLAFDAEFGSN